MSCVDDIHRALQLRATHPHVEPLELLDLVFEGRVLALEECGELQLHPRLTPPVLAFVAAAFDRGMTEEEWLGWQSPAAAPELQSVVRKLWSELVVPAFTARYATPDRQPPIKPVAPARMWRIA